MSKPGTKPAWFVYIVSNNARTLYVGITNDLPARIVEHKTHKYPNAFTARYTFDRCVYFEPASSASDAARREKQIKSWRREKKVALIVASNPKWEDLSMRWEELLCVE